ncbi:MULTISPECIES: MBOAT family O-acyltransferase [unclassified Roseitalea]|uniref:MBOAT family O-acyltransferase n=1 Tax=unclassified Roseitalea TaxID=2639107 RepID=UPI00273E0746|nr:MULTISPECIES: MBOAT family O-acyltransferase [unclassified Roseitalea]
MSYLSVTWLFWMWLTVSLYWLAPRDVRQLVLMALTVVFLATRSPESAAILLAFTALTHVTGNLLVPTMRVVATGIVVMLAVLGVYKINQTVNSANLFDTVAIPLGLSYYTFRCIHFLMERYKAAVPRASAHELAGYLLFLPTIVVGPIHRYDDYRRDLNRQRFDAAMLSEGAERILYGYVKIVIVSNYLTEGVLGDYIAGLANPEAPGVIYLKIVQNGLNLYFQFSGYSDIAIGFARLLGYRVMENFNWPYLQPNIAAFWRSWHISLSRWCRDYIYSVVVARTRSPALGAMATMIAIGLWHEISLRFVLWGAYHGIGLVVWQKSQGWTTRLERSLPETALPVLHIAKVAFTVHFVWFGFLILTAETPAQALVTFGKLIAITEG